MAVFTKHEINDMTKRYIRDVKPYGGANVKAIKKMIAIALQIEDKEEHYKAMTDEQLANMTVVLRQRLADGQTLDNILVDAYAVCRETARRVLGQRHYFVQLLGGIALHQGKIAEMGTGEGKTLTETLPAYLNALAGKGVHIVTVNEYLAMRDASWMGKIFRYLHLTVGAITAKQMHQEKQNAYACDITYGTNNEFGFDYLRDNMAKVLVGKVQRGHSYVIIDEVDSILIDEARTPLIISGASGKSSDMYAKANSFVCTLKASTNMNNKGELVGEEEDFDGDFVVNEKQKSVQITDRGVAKAERYFAIDNLADGDHADLSHHIDNALRAHYTMKRDNQYLVERGEIVIIDEHTGRKMDGRRYSNGLHQAIEAKEHVTIKQENRTLASITFQNYFKLYTKMSGMTGTAKTEEEEFNSIYDMDVVVIPTNLPSRRVDNADIIYTTRQGKIGGIVDAIADIHATGQPILIGTVSVEGSEELSALLVKRGIKHNLLNAKNHKKEADIIAQAGRLGAVTLATNMAGRGTDILLGGNAEFLAKQALLNQGLTTEQIEAGTAYEVTSPEDIAVRDQYKALLDKYSQETRQEHDEVIALGGLYVLGTERHDSRRIDNQLRGRAGRQGDPGSTLFYLSTEDNLMRRFGSTMASVMNMFKWDANEGMQNGMLSKQMERAQRSVESSHFSARKHILEYDDINNRQRKIIYQQRDSVLSSDSVHDNILTMATIYARKVLEEAVGGTEEISQWNLGAVNAVLAKYIPDMQEPCLVEGQYSNARQAHEIVTQTVINVLQERYNAPLDNEDVPMEEAERYILLSNIDRLWMDHLENLDSVKTSVAMQSYGNRKPLDVYKQEAYMMFEELNDTIAYDTIKHVLYVKLRRRLAVTNKQDDGKLSLKSPCPCGSGKKYKDCCYAKDKLAKANASDTANQDKPTTKQEEYAQKRAQRKNGKK